MTLRCNLAAPGCAEYTPDKKNPQLDPPGAIEGQQYVGKDALEDDVKARLKERAIADGQFFDGVCPTERAAERQGRLGPGLRRGQVHEELHLERAGRATAAS